METSWLPLRPELEGETPYGAPQVKAKALLNVNENPYAPSPQLLGAITEAVAQAAQNLNRYPDRDFMALREELAAYLKAESAVSISPDGVWAANGSNEVMTHILAAFSGPGTKVATFTPSYSMYPEYVRNAHATFMAAPRQDDFTLDMAQVKQVLEQRPSVLLLASPNNPTGTALAVEDIDTICALARESGPGKADTLVVIDEAYGEFRRQGVASAATLLPKHRNLIVSRTMSKAFGAAGLRLGYCVADPLIIQKLQIVRLPYHLSALTQATAIAALRHRDELSKQVATIARHRDEMVEYLRSHGWQVAPSDANFVFFGRFENRHETWQKLLDLGVLIREVGPEGWMRVSIGSEAENQLFKDALEEVTGK